MIIRLIALIAVVMTYKVTVIDMGQHPQKAVVKREITQISCKRKSVEEIDTGEYRVGLLCDGQQVEAIVADAGYFNTPWKITCSTVDGISRCGDPTIGLIHRP